MSKSKMTKCKACGSEISKSAKTCPSCGEKNKKKKPLLGIIILTLGLILLISSVSDSEEPTKVDSPNTNQSETTTTKQANNNFTIGETAELKGVSVTLVDITENNGSQFNEPTDGNVFVLCEFEIENNSDKEIAVSSMLSFEAYCDDYTCAFSLSALLESDKNQLDGKVAPGKKFNGVIGYEVPADWKELEVRFMPDFWSGKDIIFVANK